MSYGKDIAAGFWPEQATGDGPVNDHPGPDNTPWRDQGATRDHVDITTPGPVPPGTLYWAGTRCPAPEAGHVNGPGHLEASRLDPKPQAEAEAS